MTLSLIVKSTSEGVTGRTWHKGATVGLRTEHRFCPIFVPEIGQETLTACLFCNIEHILTIHYILVFPHYEDTKAQDLIHLKFPHS